VISELGTPFTVLRTLHRVLLNKSVDLVRTNNNNNNNDNNNNDNNNNNNNNNDDNISEASGAGGLAALVSCPCEAVMLKLPRCRYVFLEP
jgi:hypothetical protein